VGVQLQELKRMEDPRLSFSTPEFKEAQRVFTDNFKVCGGLLGQVQHMRSPLAAGVTVQQQCRLTAQCQACCRTWNEATSSVWTRRPQGSRCHWCRCSGCASTEAQAGTQPVQCRWNELSSARAFNVVVRVEVTCALSSWAGLFECSWTIKCTMDH
jgi:hypothetical protein